MSSALFGILQLDRGDPLGFANVPGLLQAWLQDAGGFAAVGLVLYLLYTLSVPTDKSQSERMRVPVSTWMLAMAALSLICYAGVLALLILGKGEPPFVPPPDAGTAIKIVPPEVQLQLRPVLLAIAGLLALLGIGEPFVRDIVKVRGRRIWALTRLGFKEALQFRIHWALLALVLLPFLFRNVWMSNVRPTDEFRTLIVYVIIWDTVWVVAIGLLLSSFSLPNDIKNQTIHTVITKPVERFEVVLGRFFGYSALMTLALGGMTLINLIFINTATIDAKSQEESAKARVPVRGKIEFKSRRAEFEGTNVGREFEYRKYIAGHKESPQRAVWHFAKVPSSIASAPHDVVPVEFTFDVFRMTKGEENKGVSVSLRFVTHRCLQVPPQPEDKGNWQWADNTLRSKYDEAVKEYKAKGIIPETARPENKTAWEAVNKLAEEHGYFEFEGKEVFDYTVMGVEVPAGLFRNAAQGEPGKDAAGKPKPRVSVYVKCESPGQLLGMAEPDLYLLEANQRFSTNFVKGAIGLWCRLCIIIGLAVTCSTYLSGVLSLLSALLIYLVGYATDHLNDLANNRNIGGGPFESISRLVKAETPTTPTGESAGARILVTFDKGFAWLIRRVQNIIPDVESFTWTQYVSEGFNISIENLAVNVLVMVGYLLPWGILAYYLMKSREVAN